MNTWRSTDALIYINVPGFRFGSVNIYMTGMGFFRRMRRMRALATLKGTGEFIY